MNPVFLISSLTQEKAPFFYSSTYRLIEDPLLARMEKIARYIHSLAAALFMNEPRVVFNLYAFETQMRVQKIQGQTYLFLSLLHLVKEKEIQVDSQKEQVRIISESPAIFRFFSFFQFLSFSLPQPRKLLFQSCYFLQDFFRLSLPEQNLCFTFQLLHELSHFHLGHLKVYERKLSQQELYQKEHQADLAAARIQGHLKGAFLSLGLLAKYFGNIEKNPTHPSVLNRLSYLVSQADRFPKIRERLSYFHWIWWILFNEALPELEKLVLKVSYLDEIVDRWYQYLQKPRSKETLPSIKRQARKWFALTLPGQDIS